MQLNLNISGYEGPLDLLLELSKKQKVDIKKISILELANQYLDFIDQNVNQIKLSADYLVMATLLALLSLYLLSNLISSLPYCNPLARYLLPWACNNFYQF